MVKWDLSEPKNDGTPSKPVLMSKPCMEGNFLPIYGIFGYDKLNVGTMYGPTTDTKRIFTISNEPNSDHVGLQSTRDVCCPVCVHFL